MLRRFHASPAGPDRDHFLVELDSDIEGYIDKLAGDLSLHAIRSITVAHMEVPDAAAACGMWWIRRWKKRERRSR